MFDNAIGSGMARIVFDLDGTLIDSAPDIHAIANALLRGRGVHPLTLAEARSFVGRGAAAFVRRMRAARGLPDSDQDALLDAFMARYDGAVDLTRPYPGVPDALARLAAAGHVMGVCTNKPLRPAQTVLAHLDLARHMAVVIGGDSLPVPKPDPDPLNAAFEALPDGPEIFVGDSEIDAETARAAHVPFVLFTEGYRSAAPETLPHVARFDHFDALPGLVDRLLAQAA